MSSCASPLRVTAVLALLAAPAALGGCGTLGPSSIANSRAAYNDVLTRTNDEQLLNTLVRMRFGETFNMLKVTAITAHTEMSIGSGVNAGIGPQRNYDGNLVPFSIDGNYLEAPTISYEPVGGKENLKQLVTPISLDLWGLLVDSVADTEGALLLLTNGIEGLDCPVHYESPRAAQLREVLKLMAQLRRAGVLTIAYRTNDDVVAGVDLVMENYAEANLSEATELMRLLRKPMPQQAGGPMRFPLQMGRIATGPEALRVQTRSTLELLQLGARGVEVPEEQLQAGIAPPVAAASAQNFLQVHSSVAPPADPFVAVQYRGHWYWVASNDIASKRGFGAMTTLLQACLLSENTSKPQLTLPVN